MAILEATQSKGSKWEITTQANKIAHPVHRLPDMVAFASEAREAPHIAGVLPKYQKVVAHAAMPQRRNARGLWRLRPAATMNVTRVR